MKQQLDELLQKDMTRQEFIATLGLGIISILGFSSILKFLLEGTNPSHKAASPSRHGYGASSYGR